MKKQELKKNEERLRNLWDTFKRSNIQIIGVPEGEEEQQEGGWKEVSEVMKGKDLHPRWLYPAKLSFRMEGQIKCFLDKVKWKELIITKPLLYEMLKGLI